MNIVAVIVGVCLLGVGAWFSQNTTAQSNQEETTVEEITATPDPSQSPSPTGDISATLTPTKTNTPAPSNTPSNTSVQNNSNNNSNTDHSSFTLSEFIYPGATVVSSSERRTELSTGEKASAVTNWYKDKITKAGMNAKSFVSTTTNGVVVNKLVAAGQSREIKVDITAPSLSSSVKIIVEVN